MMSWGEKVGIKYMETFILLNYMKAYVSMYFLHLMLTFPAPQNDVMVNAPFLMAYYHHMGKQGQYPAFMDFSVFVFDSVFRINEAFTKITYQLMRP